MPHRFRKNLGIATVTSLISFAISLALTPIMTRWYQPEDYGVFAVINNLATFLASLFLLSLPNALPILSTWHTRARLLKTLVALTILAFGVTTIGTMTFLAVSYAKGLTNASDWVFALMPVLVLAISLHRITQSWANADGAFNAMAMARIVHPLVAKPFAIVASMLSTANPVFIAFFECIAYFAQAATMTRGRTNRLKQLLRGPKRSDFALGLAVIRRHKDYALFLNFVNLLTLGFIALQALIVSGAYSHTETGHFALAMSMASLPIQLISMATAPVIYHRLIACGRDNPHTLGAKTYKLIMAFALIGAIPYLTIFYYGPELFRFAFGQTWVTSGNVASILALPFFLQFLYTPASSIFRVTSTFKLQFRIDLIFTLATVLIFFLATQKLAFLDAVTLFAAAVSVHQLVGIGFCLYVASIPKSRAPALASVK